MPSLSTATRAVTLSLSVAFAAPADAVGPARPKMAAQAATVRNYLKLGECIKPADLPHRLLAANQEIVASMSNPADLDFQPDWVSQNPRAVDLIDNALMVTLNPQTRTGWTIVVTDSRQDLTRRARNYNRAADPDAQKAHIAKGFCYTPQAIVYDVHQHSLQDGVNISANEKDELRTSKRACGTDYKKGCLPYQESAAALKEDGYRLILEGRLDGNTKKGRDSEFFLLVHPGDKDGVIIFKKPDGTVREDETIRYQNTDPALHLNRT